MIKKCKVCFIVILVLVAVMALTSDYQVKVSDYINN